MWYKLTIMCMVLAGCSDDLLISTNSCGVPCYTGKEETLNVGICSPGLWDCDTRICKYEILPREEICNGLDDDCDGNLSVQEQDPDGDGITLCAGDCEPRNKDVYPGRKEECNGIDDNCNGIIDEEQPPEIEFIACYDGLLSDLRFGECRPGYIICQDGELICDLQVIPSYEICDGLDNNCDGNIDEDLLSQQQSDVVLIIDESGSMIVYMDLIQTALRAFALSHIDTNFALISSPPWDSSQTTVLRSNFTNGENIITFIDQLPEQSHIAQELVLDSLIEIGSTKNELNLNWTGGNAKKFIIFSDEEARGYDIERVIAKLRQNSVSLFVFTMIGPRGVAESYELAYELHGDIFTLDTTPENMILDLNSIIDLSCGD